MNGKSGTAEVDEKLYLHAASGEYLTFYNLARRIAREIDGETTSGEVAFVIRNSFEAVVSDEVFVSLLGEIGVAALNDMIFPLVYSSRIEGKKFISYTNHERQDRETASIFTRELNRRKYEMRKKVDWSKTEQSEYFDDHLEVLLLSCIAFRSVGDEVDGYEQMKDAWLHYGLVSTVAMYGAGLSFDVIARGAKDDLDVDMLLRMSPKS